MKKGLVKNLKKHNIILELTSFRCISADARHFYGKLYSTDHRIKDIEIKRKVTQKDLDSGDFYTYELGQFTTRFDTVDELINTAINIWQYRFEYKGWALDIEDLFEINRSISYWLKRFPDMNFYYIEENWMA